MDVSVIASSNEFPKRLGTVRSLSRPKRSCGLSGSGDSPWRTESGFLLQVCSGLDGLQERISMKRIHYRLATEYVAASMVLLSVDFLIPLAHRMKKTQSHVAEKG